MSKSIHMNEAGNISVRYKIPYFYKTDDAFKPNHLNCALTGCKRLGLDAKLILLGEKEWKDVDGWAYTGGINLKETNESGNFLFGIKFCELASKSGVILECEEWKN